MKSIALEDFLNYRCLSALQYAPGGRAAAFVVTVPNEEENTYESRLWLYDGQLRQMTDLGHESSFLWESRDTLLFPAVRSAKEKKRQEAKEQFTSFYRLNIRGGEAVHAFTLPFAVQHLEKTDWGYLAVGSIDAGYPDYYAMTEEERADVAKHYEEEKDYEVLDEIPFWLNGGGITNKKRSALFTVTPEGKATRITEPLFDVDGVVCTGNSVYFTGRKMESKMPLKNGAIYCLDALTGKVRTALSCPELEIGAMQLVGKQIWFSASDCARHGVNQNGWIYTLDLETDACEILRKEEYSLYGSVGSDCRYGGGEQWQAKDGCLYHVTTREGNALISRLLPDGSVEPVVTKAGSADCIALSDDADSMLVIGFYDGRLQELYRADLKTGELQQLSHFNDAVLEGKYVAEPRSMTIESQGLSIEGWVLLPKDYDPDKKYPAVLDIHGGPKTVYGPVFCHEMQVWAGMGYFVFFCNPKGSDGRDNEFMDIFGHYGETDFANIMDFTDAVLKAYPQIDPARVCVTGGSYGGFMTNWTIGHTNRFCCAATQRSISNWLSFYGVSDIGFYFATDQNAADFFTDHKKLWDHSPLKYAANIETPTLFIHSDEDYRCPLEQGLQLYTALKDRGVPARLCMFHGENHELSRSGKPKHRVRRLKEITDWFETYSAEKT